MAVPGGVQFFVGFVEFARDFLYETSDDEENDIVEKVDNYAELSIPNMSDRQFQMNFRMTAGTFEDLLNKVNIVNNEVEPGHPGGYPRTALEKELLLTVWYLSTTECFRSVAERFGIAKSTSWSVLYRTCMLLLRVNKKFKVICWPSREKQTEIKQHFHRRANEFPGIIGCIDGSHIEITAPKDNHVSYINRKGYHSVLLQGVCDHEKRFIDVYAGEAGSIHDYTLYRRSDLCSGIETGDIMFYENNHIVGDLAYKLNSFLLVGFKNNGQLTDRQKNFNLILSKARVMIENAFALLKGRFRRLKFLETVRLDLIALLIMSGCILHNICIMNGDFLDDVINLEEERLEENRRNPRNFPDIDLCGENNAAVEKRNNIVNALPQVLRQ